LIGSRGRAATDHSRLALSRGAFLWWLWPVSVIVGVVYASLLPFDLSWSAFQPANGFGLGAIGWRDTSREDIATNLLVYVPIGFTLLVFLAGKRPVGWTHALTTVIFGAVVSVVAEGLQTGTASRVASWTDVILNAAGTALGVMIGVGWDRLARVGLARLRRRINERPFSTASVVLVLGLFVYHLSPFDWVTDTESLHASFGRARLAMVGPPWAPAEEPPWTAVLDQLGGCAWFALLAYLLGLSAREAKRPPALSFASTLRDGLLLVVLIELMQVFTESHIFDPAAIMLRAVAVAFGGWCSIYVVDSITRSSWRRRPGMAVPNVFLVWLGAFQVTLLLLGALDSSDWSLRGLTLAGVQDPPFEQPWRQPIGVAAHDMFSSIVTYAALVVTLAVLLRRGRVANAWLTTGAAVTLLALGIEVLRCARPAHGVDFTGPLFALFSAIGVATIYPVLRPAGVHGASSSAR